jgi:hypothetical protein
VGKLVAQISSDRLDKETRANTKKHTYQEAPPRLLELSAR